MRVITSFIPTLLLASLVLAPLAGLQAAESVNLSANHAASVDRQRRIFFQYDPAADIQRKGGFGSDMGSVMSYVFDSVCQPESQLDAICIDVSNEGVAHYHSKILPAIQHPGLMQWREQGLDYFAISVNRKGPFPPSA
jgi:hypothetical protein